MKFKYATEGSCCVACVFICQSEYFISLYFDWGEWQCNECQWTRGLFSMTHA